MLARMPPSRANVFTIPASAPFLAVLIDALRDGRLVPGFPANSDPLELARATIYLPTRRACRLARDVFLDRLGTEAAILPRLVPLGDIDEDEIAFAEAATAELAEAALAIPKAIDSLERRLLLAELILKWANSPDVRGAEGSPLIANTPSAALGLADDLARLMDDMTTRQVGWDRLDTLVPDDLDPYWQLSLRFLRIAREAWPALRAERDAIEAAERRDLLIEAEAKRLAGSDAPVIAAGSTGSIPATAELLAAISRLPGGAIVLPGLDRTLDEASFQALVAPGARPAVLGHPQYGLARLIGKIGVLRSDVEELGTAEPHLALRAALVGEALRPAETTELWAETRSGFSASDIAGAFAEVTLLEAASERDEAVAIAVALKQAVEAPGQRAALVTGDRALARRVSVELKRFGVVADDSGGTPLANSPAASLLRLALEAAFRPGDPVGLLSLLKHPLLGLGLERAAVRHAAELLELVALRGGTGRPDIVSLPKLFENRLTGLGDDSRPPFWFSRLTVRSIEDARSLLARLTEALAPLSAFRGQANADLAALVQASVVALESLGRSADGGLGDLYAGDAGEKLAELLRGLVAASASLSFAASEWPDVMDALIAPETVKPAQGTDRNIAIWGALEARLQDVDTLVIGGLNEGVWPRKPESDRFMSRLMKTGIDLEPPERRIGLAAHDFQMAMGARRVVLARSARSGDAPAVPSRWLQRLLTFIGNDQAATLRRRGDELLAWARALDTGPKQDFAPRPQPKPPLAVRPTHFSVTEIETLRRDPYAVYARRILGLMPLDALIRDPGAAERGTLFHAILHLFSSEVADPRAPDALAGLIAAGRACFAEAALPADVEAVWWPRFEKLAANIVKWERTRADAVTRRHAEERAGKTPVGQSGVTLSGYADRVDLLAGGMADILDYKTGSSPSKAQAHTLLAPQLALEGALLRRGAFKDLGAREPSQLAFIRLKPNGEVFEESILEHNRQPRTAADLAEEAWARLEKLLIHYADPQTGYLSRALPFREGETDGDYDHLARVLEWSAGGDAGDEGGEA